MENEAICKGITVKLSEIQKVMAPDGRLHILHCDCLRVGLFWRERERHGKRLDVKWDGEKCPKCHLYPWELRRT